MDINETQSAVTVDPNALNILEKGSTHLFDKKLDELNFEQVSLLLGGLVMSMTQAEKSNVSDEGRVIIDSELDGKEAIENYGIRAAKEFAPHIDDERTLIINVVRNKTLWETIRNREPKVLKTLRFQNEPIHYS
jgi:hypothetical protein